MYRLSSSITADTVIILVNTKNFHEDLYEWLSCSHVYFAMITKKYFLSKKCYYEWCVDAKHILHILKVMYML